MQATGSQRSIVQLTARPKDEQQNEEMKQILDSLEMGDRCTMHGNVGDVGLLGHVIELQTLDRTQRVREHKILRVGEGEEKDGDDDEPSRKHNIHVLDHFLEMEVKSVQSLETLRSRTHTGVTPLDEREVLTIRQWLAVKLLLRAVKKVVVENLKNARERGEDGIRHMFSAVARFLCSGQTDMQKAVNRFLRMHIDALLEEVKTSGKQGFKDQQLHLTKHSIMLDQLPHMMLLHYQNLNRHSWFGSVLSAMCRGRVANKFAKKHKKYGDLLGAGTDTEFVELVKFCVREMYLPGALETFESTDDMTTHTVQVSPVWQHT